MLIIGKDESSTPPKLTMSGVIDETVDFSKLSDARKSDLHILCREVNRINSVGIKIWRDFFRNYREQGGSVRFHELSPALVATMNYISDFVEIKELVSLCAPYICPKCKTSALKVLTVAEAKSCLPTPPSMACPKCSALMELDEIPEEYFSFTQK